MNDKRIAILLSLLLILASACNKATPPAPAATVATSQTPTVTVTNVIAQELARNLRLPGELLPYQDVQLYPKVRGLA